MAKIFVSAIYEVTRFFLFFFFFRGLRDKGVKWKRGVYFYRPQVLFQDKKIVSLVIETLFRVELNDSVEKYFNRKEGEFLTLYIEKGDRIFPFQASIPKINIVQIRKFPFEVLITTLNSINNVIKFQTYPFLLSKKRKIIFFSQKFLQIGKPTSIFHQFVYLLPEPKRHISTSVFIYRARKKLQHTME